MDRIGCIKFIDCVGCQLLLIDRKEKKVGVHS